MVAPDPDRRRPIELWRVLFPPAPVMITEFGDDGGMLGGDVGEFLGIFFDVVERQRLALLQSDRLEVFVPHRLLGAGEDDEEAGLIGFDDEEIDSLFGPLGFEGGPLSPVRLESRAGGLAGRKVVLTLAA